MEKLIGGKSHLRLLLADDHAIFSDALRFYLDKDFDIVGVVSDGRTLIDEAIRIKPDVIIADVGMPLLNGLDAARRIKELAPKIKIYFLDNAG
jgi:DNA-binding NarL/FixJ family response regulator